MSRQIGVRQIFDMKKMGRVFRIPFFLKTYAYHERPIPISTSSHFIIEYYDPPLIELWKIHDVRVEIQTPKLLVDFLDSVHATGVGPT